MFGYITLDKNNMYFKDHALYRAFYCGNCLLTKQRYGDLARLTTNYDMTFVQVLLHSYLGVMPEFRRSGCMLNPKKKPVVCLNPLMQQLIDLNILFAYHKLNDDLIDGGGLARRLARLSLKGSYKKAVRSNPDCDQIIRQKYVELRELECGGCTSIDRAAHPFAQMLKLCAEKVTGEKYNQTLGDLCYNVGKFVYLADALDDVDEDYASGNYNAFLASSGLRRQGKKDRLERKKFFKDNAQSIDFVLNASINSCIHCYKQLALTEGKDLLDNIITLALRRKFVQIINSDTKLGNEKL